ncbi:MAG: hypothetical protein LBB22_06885 [Treponema sp.]|jgi:transglutaminase-like putative cysteine protease|nr:hypothetical protein [Treponema sp.]
MQAILCRSIALSIFLCQFHLLAGGLSDAPVFAATLLGAFVAAFVLHRRFTALTGQTTRGAGRRCLPYVVTILLIPAAVRLLISFPRLLTGSASAGGIILWDSLLLNYDRNTFVTIWPFYWTALTTFFSLTGRRALRLSAAADFILLIAAFSIAHSSSLYELPIIRIIVFAAVIFFELAAFIFSSPPEMRPKKKDYAAAVCVLFLLAAICGAMLVRPLQEQALEQGGGLLQPKLFSFDFAPYLRLENEISMNDDLIFIVRKNSKYETEDAEFVDEIPTIIDIDGDYDFETDFYDYDNKIYRDDHYLMRRFVLSAYNTKEEKGKAIGFFRDGRIDEDTQSAQLPQGMVKYNIPPYAAREKLKQEYYLVNIDSSAFIAMNEPAETLPFESWDASSFKSAYSVTSLVSVCAPIELINAVPSRYNAETLNMMPEDYAYYTRFSDSKNKLTEREKKITSLAEELTAGTDNYWEKIQFIYQYLKFGNYRYSLKPGIAPDGDQLEYFLFDVKKGYCSYFAFAFASLLRSINIPCRVAVGFFLNPDENKLDFYPIRSNMAHAWVEVWFPDFGWIEYDPTTDKLAEDESFEFSTGIPEELFERLMKEIIDNHNRLKVKEAYEKDDASSRSTARAAEFIKKLFLYIIILFIIIAITAMRFGFYIHYYFTKDSRKKTLRLWRHIKRRLRLAGIRKNGAETESEWINRVMEEDSASPLRALYENVSAAKYAEYYSGSEEKEFFTLYKKFNIWQKKYSPLKKRVASKSIILILCVFLLSSDGEIYTQENIIDAEELFSQAILASENEFWERAVELYTRGKTLFPLDYRFPLRLGDIYFNRELYRLAMDEFLAANNLLPNDTQLLYRLAQTAGNLNENKMAASFLESLLILEPDNHEAIGSLGWMYFKLHRLRDGEKLLIDAITRFGQDPDFCMTLGTIYSDMFNYDEAKRRYLDAVSGAVRMGSTEFAAVSYYNLSILESRFYKYAEAFISTTSSLMLADRSSGHLARGELMLRRLDFSETFNEYNKSYEIDNSQLSKLSLAQAFLTSGNLEQARLYAEDGLSSNNLYWMLNYGIDPDQYKRDLHDILFNTYGGLEKREALKARYGILDAVRGIKLRVSYRFKRAVHKLLYKKYSLLSAGAFETDAGSGEHHLEALFQYYNAFYDYKSRARDYLQAAKDFELALIPESVPYYMFETGKFLQSPAMLEESLSGFDPVWEKDLAAEVYTELALIGQKKRRPDAVSEAASRLFALNPGALRQNGIRLPVNVEISGMKDINKREAGRLIKMLSRAGFDTKTGAAAALRTRWTLRLRDNGENAVYMELYDGGRGMVTKSKSLPLPSFSAKHLCDFANAAADELLD